MVSREAGGGRGPLRWRGGGGGGGGGGVAEDGGVRAEGGGGGGRDVAGEGAVPQEGAPFQGRLEHGGDAGEVLLRVLAVVEEPAHRGRGGGHGGQSGYLAVVGVPDPG